MRRAIIIALTLGVSCLLLYGCSSETNPTDPADTTLDTSLDKRPPNIYDPPPGFDQYLVALRLRFDQIEWVQETVTFTIYDQTVTVYPDGHDPVDINFTVDPDLVIPTGSDPPTFEATIWLPKAPDNGGTLYIPGDCIIFKTDGFPHPAYGDVTLALPIMDFYDQTDYTGTFTAFTLEENAYGYPGATNLQTIVVKDWTEPYPTIPVYMEVPEVNVVTDNPSDMTHHATDPEDIGEEVD